MDPSTSSDQQPVSGATLSPFYQYTEHARWIQINNIWDRIEKVLYLLMDAFLNIYFIRAVNANLVSNGLQKYNRLVLFNKHMIVVSLLMDVLIIVAMWIPNGFV